MFISLSVCFTLHYDGWSVSCLCLLPRRDGVIAVSKESSQFTDEYLPDQRSHLYGIAIATSQCLSGEISVLLFTF